MFAKTLIKPNSYYDSLMLMRVSAQLLQLPGVEVAAVLMATEQNKRSVANPELLPPEVMAAGPNDLFIVVLAQREEQAQLAIDLAAGLLSADRPATAGEATTAVHSLEAALERRPNANLALISIPGRYVKREALKALDAGLNLFIFSDNVPLEDELELKRTALQRGLLVMGPDCGTALIGGAALGFANAVRRGAIGLVGASGTGIQEVSCLIHRLGHGVSHAIGTGSHDVDEVIGGITLIQGLKQLERDPSTSLIVVVSKPPSPSVIRKMAEAITVCRKPVVVNFLDGDLASIEAAGGVVARTLEEAAFKAVEFASQEAEESLRRAIKAEADDAAQWALEARRGLAGSQKYVRALYSGGTFASEAAMLLREWIGSVHSNGKVKGVSPLPNPRISVDHSVVDLGDDLFTVGRPHPMLEPSVRRERIIQEAADPETAVILLDVVLGYGAHPDPAGELVRFVAEARQLASSSGRRLPVVTSVCGVDEDPQNRERQVRQLREAGVLVMPTNVQATALAAQIVTGVRYLQASRSV